VGRAARLRAAPAGPRFRTRAALAEPALRSSWRGERRRLPSSRAHGGPRAQARRTQLTPPRGGGGVARRRAQTRGPVGPWTPRARQRRRRRGDRARRNLRGFSTGGAARRHRWAADGSWLAGSALRSLLSSSLSELCAAVQTYPPNTHLKNLPAKFGPTHLKKVRGNGLFRPSFSAPPCSVAGAAAGAGGGSATVSHLCPGCPSPTPTVRPSCLRVAPARAPLATRRPYALTGLCIACCHARCCAGQRRARRRRAPARCAVSRSHRRARPRTRLPARCTSRAHGSC